MGNLSDLQLHMLDMLLNEPLSAFKLRSKYTRSFDQMFSYIFGVSFGVEIEIHPNFYKNKAAGIYFHSGNLNTSFQYTKVIDKIQDDLKSPYKTRNYMDGALTEYTFPVCAKNLHILYKYLNHIARLLKGPLGTPFDTSSSMHIHIKQKNRRELQNRRRELNGSKNSDNTNKRLYEHASDLLLPQYSLKLGNILNIYDTDVLINALDGILYEFIPYITYVHNDWNLDGFTWSIDHNFTFKSIEIRLFIGSTDLALIMKRAMLFRSLYVLTVREDSYPLNLFLRYI